MWHSRAELLDDARATTMLIEVIYTYGLAMGSLVQVYAPQGTVSDQKRVQENPRRVRARTCTSDQIVQVHVSSDWALIRHLCKFMHRRWS